MAELHEELPPVQKKKIHVNAASLVDLKAALFRKQQEVKQGGTSTTSGKPKLRTQHVSEKTASIWRKKSSKKPATGRGRGYSDHFTQSNLTSQEELDLARSKAALEAKAVLYDKLSSRAAGGVSSSSEDDEDDDKPRIMVDFQRKIYEEVSRQRKIDQLNKTETSVSQDTTGTKDGSPIATTSDEEWVDYTDSLGRSRRCMKKDLTQMKLMDKEMDLYHVTNRSSGSSSPDLLSENMRRERERQRWEEEAYRRTMAADDEGGDYEDEHREDNNSRKETPVHYQTVRYKEIRNVGTGYYEFDTDEQKRDEQMKMLNKLREETKDQRVQRERIKEKRKAILEAKLAKIRQKKNKDGQDNPGNEENKSILLSSGIADFDFEAKITEQDSVTTVTSTATNANTGNPVSDSLEELVQKQVSEAREKSEAEERKKRKRPWDRGKVVDPIHKQKKELEDERLPEFAPPSVYNKNKTPSSHSITDNSIYSQPLLPSHPNVSLLPPPPSTSTPLLSSSHPMVTTSVPSTLTTTHSTTPTPLFYPTHPTIHPYYPLAPPPPFHSPLNIPPYYIPPNFVQHSQPISQPSSVSSSFITIQSSSSSLSSSS